MDESNAIRAITIGVSTFIAMLTISAVLMYYNTAKATVQEIGTGADLYGNYSKHIQDILVKPTGSKVSGTDVINILNYFYDDPNVNVTVKNIHLINSSKINEINNMNNSNQYEAFVNYIIPTQSVIISVENLEDSKLNIILEGEA